MQNDLLLVIRDVFRALDFEQDIENEIFIVDLYSHSHCGNTCFYVDTQTMTFNFKLTEEKSIWLPPCPAAGFWEGDWDIEEIEVVSCTRTGLDSLHLARLLYVYLAKYADVKAIPRISWQALRQMALNKWAKQ